MDAQDQATADALFEALVHECMEVAGSTREDAERIQRSNIGYFAAYYGNETRERVERLYRCEHPQLGAIAKTGPLSPREVFEIGYEMGRRRRMEESDDV
jgi:hypothetical protein